MSDQNQGGRNIRIHLSDGFMRLLATYAAHEAIVNADFRLIGFYKRVARAAAGKATTLELKAELESLLAFALDVKTHQEPVLSPGTITKVDKLPI